MAVGQRPRVTTPMSLTSWFGASVAASPCRFAYKDEYEKFKLYLTIILLLGAVVCRFVLHYR